MTGTNKRRGRRPDPVDIASMPEPAVSIIVPVRNAERTLETTFRYLSALDYPSYRLEVVLADGGSTDRTVEIVRQWQRGRANLKLVEVPGCQSPGHARNEALKVATGEFVLFTDGDCAPNRDWVRQLLQPFFADEQIGGVGGEVLTLRTDPDNVTEAYCEQVGFLSVSGRCGLSRSEYFPGLRQQAAHEVNGGNYSPFFATANVAFCRSAIDEVGGEFWSEPTGEDVDFCLRLLKRGWKLYFAKEAVVRHMHRVSLDSYLRQWYGYGYGHPLLVQRHAKAGLEIVLQLKEPAFIDLPWPGKGIVHVGAFHLVHLWGAMTLGAGLVSLVMPGISSFALGSLAMFVFSAGLYFSPCLKLRPLSKMLSWCKIRYLTNWAFIKGAMDGARKFGGVCVEPSW